MLISKNVADTTKKWGNTSFSPYALLNTNMLITLSDTTQINKLKVKIGTSDGASDIFQKNFNYSQTGILSDGTSFTRNGLDVNLFLGVFIGLNIYFAELQIEYLDGTLSTPIKYSYN